MKYLLVILLLFSTSVFANGVKPLDNNNDILVCATSKYKLDQIVYSPILREYIINVSATQVMQWGVCQVVRTK